MSYLVEFLEDFAGYKKTDTVEMSGIVASSLKGRGIIKLVDEKPKAAPKPEKAEEKVVPQKDDQVVAKAKKPVRKTKVKK